LIVHLHRDATEKVSRKHSHMLLLSVQCERVKRGRAGESKRTS
jgi:hypothetical protein